MGDNGWGKLLLQMCQATSERLEKSSFELDSEAKQLSSSYILDLDL